MNFLNKINHLGLYSVQSPNPRLVLPVGVSRRRRSSPAPAGPPGADLAMVNRLEQMRAGAGQPLNDQADRMAAASMLPWLCMRSMFNRIEYFPQLFRLGLCAVPLAGQQADFLQEAFYLVGRLG